MSLELKTFLKEDSKKIASYMQRAGAIEVRIESAKKDLINLEEQINKNKSSEVVPIGGANALEETIKQAPELLMSEIRLAVQTNKEFNDELFLERLGIAAWNPKTVTLIPLKNGSIKVKLNLNETAGSLSDYGNAIRKVRGDLEKQKQKGGKKAPKGTPAKQADLFWMEKFYKAARENGPANVKRGKGENRKEEDRAAWFTAKYWETISQRLLASGKVAPFWEILDKGTPKTSIKGSGVRKGGKGTAYPMNTKTNFTGKAQTAIKVLYDSLITKEKESKGKEIKVDGEVVNIVTAKDILKKGKELVVKAEKEVEKLLKLALDPQKEILARVEKYEDDIDKIKLKEVIKALKEKNVDSLPLQSRQRIQLGVRGVDKRVRLGTYLRLLSGEE